MSKNNDGGPAFPLMVQVPEGVLYETGMTLRDYFAAKAMMQIMHRPGQCKDAHDVARLSYEMADAMLAERDK